MYFTGAHPCHKRILAAAAAGLVSLRPRLLTLFLRKTLPGRSRPTDAFLVIVLLLLSYRNTRSRGSSAPLQPPPQHIMTRHSRADSTSQTEAFCKFHQEGWWIFLKTQEGLHCKAQHASGCEIRSQMHLAGCQRCCTYVFFSDSWTSI